MKVTVHWSTLVCAVVAFVVLLLVYHLVTRPN